MNAEALQQNNSAVNTNTAAGLHEKDLAACLAVIEHALADVKAKDVVVIDVRSMTNFTDKIVIASGTSSRHVKALADNVAVDCKKAGFAPIGVEGERDAEWVLIDLGLIVVHVMLPTAREFYDLESMWTAKA